MRKKVFEKIGLYNLDYTINSDYDLILRMLERNMKGFPLGFAVSRYRDGGVSGGYATFLERLKLLENHGVSRVQRRFTVATSITKLFLSGLLNRAGISYSRREPDSRERGAVAEEREGWVGGGYATFLERLKLLEDHGVSRVQWSFTVANSITKLFLSGLLNRAGISYRRGEPVRREGGAETERLHG